MRIFNKDLYWIRSAFFTMLQSISGVFFSIGTFYLLVRILPPHEYGVWVLFMVTATVIETIRNGLIQNALIKFLASEEEQSHPSIISASALISAALTLLCCAGILIFSGFASRMWESPELSQLFHIYVVAFILSGLVNLFNTVLQANLKFREIFISTIFTQGLFFTYVLCCFLFNQKISLVHLVYVQLINTVISGAISFLFVRRKFLFSFTIHEAWIRRLLNYGKYAFGTSVSAILSVTVDQMMLGAMLSPVSAGAYNVAVRITNLLDIPTNAIAVIVFPQSAKRMVTEGKAGIKYLYEKSVGTLLAILLPGIISLYLFSGFVVTLIAGNEYRDTIPLLHLTLLYCLFTPFGRQFGSILDSIGKTKTTFWVVITVTLINIGLNYIFIESMGVIGAALATLLAHIIGFYIGQLILRKELGISLKNIFIYAFEFYPEFYRKYLGKNDKI